MRKTYKALLIFPSSLKEEEVEKAIDRIREEVERLKGSVDAVDVKGKRSFARPMKKKQAGLYVQMGLDLAPENVAALRARFKLNTDIFRVQITCVEGRGAPVAEKPEEGKDGKSE